MDTWNAVTSLSHPASYAKDEITASAAALATKCTHQGRFLKLGQVDKDRDNFGTPRRHDSSLDFFQSADVHLARVQIR